MADEIKIEDMPTDELNAALQSGLDQLDGKAQAETEVKPDDKPETKVEAGDKPADKPADEKPADTTKVDDGEKDGDGDGNPYKKRIDRLVRKRDNLQETVAERDARIAALEQENAALKAGGEKPKVDDEEEAPKEDISKTIHKVLDEREGKTKTESEKAKAVDQEFEELVKKVPAAAKRKAEITDLASKFPGLTFEALDRILSPADHIDPIEANRKDAKRMDISSHSRADLETEKDMSKATPAEQEKYLRDEIAAGRLVV